MLSMDGAKYSLVPLLQNLSLISTGSFSMVYWGKTLRQSPEWGSIMETDCTAGLDLLNVPTSFVLAALGPPQSNTFWNKIVIFALILRENFTFLLNTLPWHLAFHSTKKESVADAMREKEAESS